MTLLSMLMMLLVATLAYAWLLYPLILRLAAKSRRSTSRELQDHDAATVAPHRVAALVAAHNEGEHVEARLHNLVDILESARRNGESGHFRILLGSDGSTDSTVQCASRFQAGNGLVSVHDFGEQRGKIAVLKELVAEVLREEPQGSVCGDGGTILLFTDANTVFTPDALSRLLGHFNDPTVGGVCGRLNLTSKETEEDRTNDAGSVSIATDMTAEGTYWGWENRLKEWESDLDSCLGANGAIYAVRANLFWQEIPSNTIVDDFVIGMKVREQGARMVYEPAAVAQEKLPAIADEWRRRVRIGAGDFQALWLCRRLLRHSYGAFAWMFWSHKVLRWFTPHLLIILLLVAVRAWHRAAAETGSVVTALTHSPLASLVLAGTVAVAACALAGRAFCRGRAPRSRAGRLFAAAEHFAAMQAALFVGFVKFCTGRLEGQWQRTPRGETADVE